MRRVSLLFALTSPVRGGVEEVVLALARRLDPGEFRLALAAPAPLARWHGARVVETYHGREGWRTGLIGGNFLADRLVSRFVDRVIAVSEAARAFLISGKGYDARKIVVVPNGRDLSVFRPGAGGDAVRKELGIDRATPLVGVLGRLEEQKGHVYLLEAWPSVLAEFPDARLLLVGDGSLRGALERRVDGLGIR